MLFSTEMDVKFMEMLQECYEWCAFSHLAKALTSFGKHLPPNRTFRRDWGRRSGCRL